MKSWRKTRFEVDEHGKRVTAGEPVEHVKQTLLSMRPGVSAGQACSCGWHSHWHSFEKHLEDLGLRADHEFEAFDGATGHACTKVVERGGHGEDCGLPPEAHRPSDKDLAASMAVSFPGWSKPRPEDVHYVPATGGLHAMTDVMTRRMTDNPEQVTCSICLRLMNDRPANGQTLMQKYAPEMQHEFVRTEVEITVPGGKVDDDGKFIEIPLTVVSFEPESHRLVVKISVETEIGEVLAVRTDFVPDGLMGPGNHDAWQDLFMHRVQAAATGAYIEAVGK